MQTMHHGPERPKAYWAVAALALLWNLLGLAMFVVHVTTDEARLAALDEAQRRIHLATPGWVTAAFGLAVAGGVLGALGLLLRRRWAVPMFGVSLLALLAQVAGTFLATPAWAVYGPAGTAMPALLLLVALALLAWARRCAARGWLR